MNVWSRAKRARVLVAPRLQRLRGLAGRADHVYDRRRANRFLAPSSRPWARFQDAAVPLGVMVTDALCGERRVITSGSLLPAVLASAAAPGPFPPVRVDGRLHFDGGIVIDAGFDHAPRIAALAIDLLGVRR